jgi:hypothetical protein
LVQVLSFELAWSNIVGIDFKWPLTEDARLVFEATTLTKRVFDSVSTCCMCLFSSSVNCMHFQQTVCKRGCEVLRFKKINCGGEVATSKVASKVAKGVILCKRMCDFIVTPPVLWMCMEDFEYCIFKQLCDVGWASTAGCSFLSAVAIALLQAGGVAADVGNDYFCHFLMSGVQPCRLKMWSCTIRHLPGASNVSRSALCRNWQQQRQLSTNSTNSTS